MKNTLALLTLIGLILITSIFRLTPILTSSPSGLMSDDAMYASMARAFYEGNLMAVIHPYWMPLYPLVSAFFFRFVQSWTFASLLTSAVAGTLLLIPIYFVGKYYAGRIAGLLSAYLLLFFFPLVHSSHSSYAEPLQIFLFWMGVGFYLKTLETNKIIFALLSGIFWGLTFLTRTEGLLAIVGLLAFNFVILSLIFKKHFRIPNVYFKIILFILSSLYLVFGGLVSIIIIIFFFFLPFLLSNDFLDKNKIRIKANLFNLFKITSFALVGFAIFYFSYNIALIIKYKKPLFSAKTSASLNYQSHYTLNKSGTSTWGQDIVFPETFNPNSEYLVNPYEFLLAKGDQIEKEIMENIVLTIRKIFNFMALPENLILFFIGIYWLLFKTQDYPKKIFLFLMLGTMTFFIVLISGDNQLRYYYFVSPIIPLGIAFGINCLVNLLKSPKTKIIALIVLILLASYSNLKHLTSRGENTLFNTNLPEYVSLFSGEKAKAYKENSSIFNLLKDKRVMGRYESWGFKYRSFFIYSPSVETLDELIDYARRWKVNYIVATSSDTDHNVSFLYLEPKDYPGLKLELSPEPGTYIYKIIYSQ